MPSALTPLARRERSTFADTQSPARRSPRHASARRATDTTRIQTKALMPIVDAGAQRCPSDRTHRRGLPATTYIGKPLDYTAAGHHYDWPEHQKAPSRRGLRAPRPGHLEQRGAAAASAAVRRVPDSVGGATTETGLERERIGLRPSFHARKPTKGAGKALRTQSACPNEEQGPRPCVFGFARGPNFSVAARAVSEDLSHVW